MQTIASDCESHLEIQGLRLRRSRVVLDTLNSRIGLQLYKRWQLTIDNWPTIAQTRKNRIWRYSSLQAKFADQLQRDLVAILN